MITGLVKLLDTVQATQKQLDWECMLLSVLAESWHLKSLEVPLN